MLWKGLTIKSRTRILNRQKFHSSIHVHRTTYRVWRHIICQK